MVSQVSRLEKARPLASFFLKKSPNLSITKWRIILVFKSLRCRAFRKNLNHIFYNPYRVSVWSFPMLYGGPYPIHPILFPVPVYLMMTGRPKSWILNKNVVTVLLQSPFKTDLDNSQMCKYKRINYTMTFIIDHHSLSYVIHILCLEAGVG